MTKRPVARIFATDAGDHRQAVSEALANNPDLEVEFIDGGEPFEDLVDLLTPGTVPTPAFVLQAQRNAAERASILAEYGALEADAVADFAGSTATNRRATAHRWREDGLIFAVEHRSRLIYPGFQFDPATRRPKPVVAEVLRTLPTGLLAASWQLAAWWVTPIDVLDWNRPVDLMDRDAAAVVTAAAVEAADWAEAARPAL